jgi:hypothetical protein
LKDRSGRGIEIGAEERLGVVFAERVPDQHPADGNRSAPRNGTLTRLWLREDSTDFVGYYSDKWFGWVSYHEPVPLIRGDFRFLGWGPVEQAEQLNAPMRKERRRKGPPKLIRIVR